MFISFLLHVIKIGLWFFIYAPSVLACDLHNINSVSNSCIYNHAITYLLGWHIDGWVIVLIIAHMFLMLFIFNVPPHASLLCAFHWYTHVLVFCWTHVVWKSVKYMYFVLFWLSHWSMPSIICVSPICQWYFSEVYINLTVSGLLHFNTSSKWSSINFPIFKREKSSIFLCLRLYISVGLLSPKRLRISHSPKIIWGQIFYLSFVS